MAEAIHSIKENDTSPILQATLKDGDGVVVNLSGSTVVFSMRDENLQTLKIDKKACVLVDAVNGVVSYTWLAANNDTDTPGLYIGEFQATNGAAIESYPNNEDNRLFIRVTPEVG